MKVYGVDIPSDKGLTNIDLIRYVQELEIECFRGVFMRLIVIIQSYHK